MILGIRISLLSIILGIDMIITIDRWMCNFNNFRISKIKHIES